MHLQFTEWSCTTIRVLQATATCPNVHTDTNLFYNIQYKKSMMNNTQIVSNKTSAEQEITCLIEKAAKELATKA